MSFLIPSSVQTMTSLEIAELTGKEHFNVLVDVRKTIAQYESFLSKLEISSMLEESSYMVNNRQQPMYKLNKQATLDIMTGYSLEMRHKVNKRWQELEAAVALPTSNDVQFDRAMKFVTLITTELNLPESGKLSVMGKLADAYGLPKQLLPSYGIDAPPQAIVTTGSSVPTMSLTTILKPYALSAKAANQILLGLGIIEERTRPSTKTGTKSFKALTDKGLQYGKNITSPSNPREVQIHWYADKVDDLLKVLGVL